MILSAIALLSLALLFGGMAFFAAGVAPLVFTRLPADQAGRFIRQVFPVYYGWVFACAGGAALALLPGRPWDALAMASVAALTLWLRQALMPRINRLSDAAQAGDAPAKPPFDSSAKQRFDSSAKQRSNSSAKQSSNSSAKQSSNSSAKQSSNSSAKQSFDAAHRLSVLLNVAQMAVALVVLLRFA